MLQQWIKRGLGVMAAVLAGLAAVAGVYWRGRAMGRAPSFTVAFRTWKMPQSP